MKKNNTNKVEEAAETVEDNVVDLPVEDTPKETDKPAEPKVHKFLGYEIRKAEKPVKEKKVKEPKQKPSKKQVAARIGGGLAVAGAVGYTALKLIGGHKAGSDDNQEYLTDGTGSCEGNCGGSNADSVVAEVETMTSGNVDGIEVNNF